MKHRILAVLLLLLGCAASNKPRDRVLSLRGCLALRYQGWNCDVGSGCVVSGMNVLGSSLFGGRLLNWNSVIKRKQGS